MKARVRRLAVILFLASATAQAATLDIDIIHGGLAGRPAPRVDLVPYAASVPAPAYTAWTNRVEVADQGAWSGVAVLQEPAASVASGRYSIAVQMEGSTPLYLYGARCCLLQAMRLEVRDAAGVVLIREKVWSVVSARGGYHSVPGLTEGEWQVHSLGWTDAEGLFLALRVVRAGETGLIFRDGFELGNTGAWEP